MLFSRGSEWRKWDLHVHTPYSYESDFSGWDSYIIKLKEKAVIHDIEAVGINDYFSIDGYEKLLEQCEPATRVTTPRILLSNGKKLYLFPVVEVRLDNFTSSGSAVNVHVVFSPDLLPATIRSSFLENLDIKYKTFSNLKCKLEDLVKIGHAEENSSNFNANLDITALRPEDKERFMRKALKVITFSSSIFEAGIEKFAKILKGSGIEGNKYLIILANKGHGGLDAFDWHDQQKDISRAGIIRQNLLNLSDICFSNKAEDIQFLLGECADTPRSEILNRFRSCKPCIWGSDAHSEVNIFHPSNGSSSDYTWIKADPTFNGLRQIIYEPIAGERVKIGPIEPDKKDAYKIIRKIKFSNGNDFPLEIEFNKNLCSIIGSRSSGKSALLAYLAHSIDSAKVEERIKGPGEGEAYHWENVRVAHSIEWDNGQTNEESPGKVIYIHQNYLFQASKNPDEIKAKIEPVLFKILPEFQVNYENTEINLSSHNQQISEYINNWFDSAVILDSLAEKLKSLGNKASIEKEKATVEQEIGKLKAKSQLSEEEIIKFQTIRADALGLKNRNKEIDTELSQISTTVEKPNFFIGFKITSAPALSGLPQKLQESIQSIQNESGKIILGQANQKVVEYKKSIEAEKVENQNKISKISVDNHDLIEKYQKNTELNKLVQNLTSYKETLNKIADLEKEILIASARRKEIETNIKLELSQRKILLEELKSALEAANQISLRGIKFQVEFGFDENLVEVTDRVNVKIISEFIDRGELKVEFIRDNSEKFLEAVYTGKQRINMGNDKKEVVKSVLTLTEKILFSAEMEGDKIGGFTESTMTPGKRALFALRLILAESEDTWPLLIDQPEDDLDIRSIYNEVVPFLIEKKKERQIIMVSHNANLVIGADSEQIVVANRNGNDRKNEDGRQFNYLTGSLEYCAAKDESCIDTLKSQGICEHACEILEGGEEAFQKREKKYGFTA